MDVDEQAWFLAVDVGNSRTKVALFESAAVRAAPRLPPCALVLAAAHKEAFPWDDLRQRVEKICGPALMTCGATVQPAAWDKFLAEWPRTGWPLPRRITTADVAVPTEVMFPEKVGLDRLLNAVAGNRIRPAGQPIVIIDSGTATTVDWLTPQGAFAGGAILPGLELAARSLHQYTALLPEIPVAELLGHVPPVGRETRAALRSGIYWAQIGAMRELVTRMQTGTPPEIILTGGAAPLLSPHFDLPHQWEPWLSLQGLAITVMRSP